MYQSDRSCGQKHRHNSKAAKVAVGPEHRCTLRWLKIARKLELQVHWKRLWEDLNILKKIMPFGFHFS